jgi:hypothetical protein
MSLDTYANLKLEIIDWSHRDDLDLKIDTFIDLAETEMFSNRIEPLRLTSSETRATASMDSTTPSRYLELPDGFVEMRKLRIQIENGESYEVFYRTPGQLNVKSSEGRPDFFTVTSQLEFDRNPDIAYSVEMQYMKKFTALSSSNTTNYILTNHPTIYLYGALWAVKKYSEEYNEAEYYYSLFINSIRGANKVANTKRYGPAPVMRVEGYTP